MDSLLGLALLALYILGMVSLAAGVTWAAIKIFPTKDRTKKKDDEKPSAPDDGADAGRLFRKSKREAAG